MKNLIYLLLILTIAGCGSKNITIKTLYPSSIDINKNDKVFIANFKNDNINQTQYIKDEITNRSIENRKIFNVQNNKIDSDFIIQGEVLRSTLNSTFYYEEDFDTTRCVRYRHDRSRKKDICVKYVRRIIPCEKRVYQVETQLDIEDQFNNIIFSKIYTKSKYENQCYRYNPPILPLSFYSNLNYSEDKFRVNTQLARKIAKDIIEDISVHYVYQKIEIIDKLDNDYSKDINEDFSLIVDLLVNGQIDNSMKRLNRLNLLLKQKSYEVLYNLALTYEAKNNLREAYFLYHKAYDICENIDKKKLINSAINRVNKNIINKQKAKLQLDNIQKQ